MGEVNGLTSIVNNLNLYNTTASTKRSTKTDIVNVLANTDVNDGAIYESSGVDYKTASKTNPELVAKLKEENNNRLRELEDLVNQTLTGQAKTFSIANGTNLKEFFANLQLSKEQIEKAKEDVAEDGYWGVKQTSERIFEFAKALSGGDKDGMLKMKEAFEKGYSAATKSWGDDLPEISKKTYEAVQKLFEDYGKDEKEN